MIGYYLVLVVVEVIVKGFEGIDVVKVWLLFCWWVMDDDYCGLLYYCKFGYIFSDKDWEVVSKMLEYMYDDWVVVCIVDVVGVCDDVKVLCECLCNYVYVFDVKFGFVCLCGENGQWFELFDLCVVGYSVCWCDFIEFNVWQVIFFNQYDLYYYIGMFGGDVVFECKFDVLFIIDFIQVGDILLDVVGFVGQYVYGNEFSYYVVYFYVYVGVYYKIQVCVCMLLQKMYVDQLDGLVGNEDCGQMSVWYVFGVFGLYVVDLVSMNYVFGSLLLDCVEFVFGGDCRLVIEIIGNSIDMLYIQLVMWNGQLWIWSWISYVELVKGGIFVFMMGCMFNFVFGCDVKDWLLLMLV